MKQWLSKINWPKWLNWLPKLLGINSRAEYLYQYEYVPRDFPVNWEGKKVYLVGNPGQEWLAGVLCPCGCGEKIELLLLEDQHPCWKLKKNKDETVSLSPSIWLKEGCKSHFFLKNGKIQWCD